MICLPDFQSMDVRAVSPICVNITIIDDDCKCVHVAHFIRPAKTYQPLSRGVIIVINYTALVMNMTKRGSRKTTRAIAINAHACM